MPLIKSSTALRSALLVAVLLALLVVYGQGPEYLLNRAFEFADLAERYPIFILALYVLRLMFLLPVSFVLLLTGMLFGVGEGMCIAVAGLLLGGGLEFLLVRWVGQPLGSKSDAVRWLAKIRRKIEQKPFQTILLLRLAFVPFDGVNMVAGWARVPLRAFLYATGLGVIPAALPVVSAGASINLDAWRRSGTLWPPMDFVNWWQLLGAGILVAMTVTTSQYFRKRAKHT